MSGKRVNRLCAAAKATTESPKRRFSRFGGYLLPFAFGAVAATAVTAVVVSKNANSGRQAEHLYLVATGLRHSRRFPDRVKAARALAKCRGADPWLVLLFLSSQTAPTGDDFEQQRQKALRVFGLGIVAVTVGALPEDVPPSVLFALTFLLNEQGRGQWSERSGIIMIRISEHSSKPIRELVRAFLKDRLGVDHGWDTSAWQAAIMERKVDGGVSAEVKPEAGTQPAKTQAKGP